jgi:hypothetical protein
LNAVIRIMSSDEKLVKKHRMIRMPIVISPKYTRATWMTNLAADHLYGWMRNQGLKPIRISGFRSIRPVIRKELFLANYQPKPLLIFYIGHGLDDAWIGHEDLRARFLKKRLIKLGKNDDWLDKDAIIHTISCYTLNKLGPALVKGKVRTYFGSTQKMLINPIDNHIEPRTVPDFVNVFTVGQKFLAAGYSTGDALRAYLQTCDNIIKKYEATGQLDNSKQLRNAYYGMKMNRDYFGLVGDPDAVWASQEELQALVGTRPDPEAE